MEAMKNDTDLKNNLSAVAHLIRGSSEGRFSITYCPGHLSKSEVERVGFKYDDLNTTQQKRNFETLKDGWNTISYDGEEEKFIILAILLLVFGLSQAILRMRVLDKSMQA